MSLVPGVADAARACFPRVSGDEPAAVAAIRAPKVFSPRERG